MHASIRQYRSSEVDEVARRAADFVPIVREVPGFSAWYVVDGGDGTLVTITLCEDRAGVEASVRLAADWVSANISDLVEGTPAVTNGEVKRQA